MTKPMNTEEILKSLHAKQYSKFTYEYFLKVMRRRLRRWTGDTAAAFYTDDQIVDELVRHGVIDEDGKIVR